MGNKEKKTPYLLIQIGADGNPEIEVRSRRCSVPRLWQA